MKILIINGSPRKQGHISKMLQLMETEARANGDEVTVIRVADLQISPCIGCMSCREKLKCCLPEDDAQRVLKQIEEAQALIIGAPCYLGKPAGTTESDVRSHRLRNDGRDLTRYSYRPA